MSTYSITPSKIAKNLKSNLTRPRLFDTDSDVKKFVKLLRYKRGNKTIELAPKNVLKKLLFVGGVIDEDKEKIDGKPQLARLIKLYPNRDDLTDGNREWIDTSFWHDMGHLYNAGLEGKNIKIIIK